MAWLSDYRMKLRLTAFIVSVLFSMASVCSAIEYVWTQKTDMPTLRWMHSASMVDGKIYVIGGKPSEPTSGVCLSTVEAYDPSTDAWIKKADILEPRAYHSSSVVDGKIYIIGGCGCNDMELSTVEEYDPASDTWTRKADMPTSRFCSSTSVVDGQIYAIGGAVWGKPSVYDTRGMSRVEMYDPLTDTWTIKTNMPTRRWGLCSGVVDGKIYAIGGAPDIIGQDKVEMYDPADDSWTVKRYMPTGRRNFSTSVLCGKIYAIGGWRASGSACFSTVEVYDPSADSWMQIADLPVVRSCLSTSVVAGKIYAIGGTPTPHPCPATSTIYELATSGPPPDFNVDGIVDVKDIMILTHYWGSKYSLCDIGPTALGDGIVDVRDLLVLAEYIEPEEREPGLIAHWKLDETEGSMAFDSVSGEDAFVIGDPLWQPIDGIVDGALQLDGTDDFISTDFVLNPANGPFSLFAWIKGGAPAQVILSQTDHENWLLADASGGNLMTELKGSGRGAGALLSQTNITDGNWHRIGFAWDGSNRILYVDDVEIARDTQTDMGSSEGSLCIGVGNTLAHGTYFCGLIDDVRIYNRVVSP